MASRPVVALLIGAHKTATTYIQSRLRNSQDALHSAGISMVSTGQFRKRITSQILNSDFSPAQLTRLLHEHTGDQRVIISDENLLGIRHSDNRLYPRARQRLERLLPAFEGYKVEVFLTVRSYPDYLVSFYTEHLRSNRFIRFERFYKHIDFNTISWLELLDDIRAAGVEKLRISDFSTLVNEEQQYFDTLLGKKGISLSPADNTPEVRRTKLTQQGYEALRFFAQKYALNSSGQLMALIDNMEQETPATPFMPIPESQRLEMEARYEAEMKELNTPERLYALAK
jgi:hypothetical protein